MIEASTAWKEIHNRFLLPETYVEIDCGISEVGLQESASASGTVEEIFSDVEKILGTSDTKTDAKYATLEHNLWLLDGTRSLLPDTGPYENAGYVSNVDQSGSVTLTLPETHTVAIPGVTIVWSSEYSEYPPVFTVTAYNGSVVAAETTVTGNTQQRCLVDLEIINYDRVTVTVHNWCLPYRRARIDYVFLGHMLTFTKNDILSYTHEQYGDLLTGEIPKCSIEFALDNTDQRWNPSNPTGLERYLSERQKLTVRYGMDVGGIVEWIKGGTFYLSEWSAPSNGLEARFVARDLFEFLLNVDLEGYVYGSLYDLISYNASAYILPEGAEVSVDAFLANYSAAYEGDSTAAEVIQKAANAACCILRYDRAGMLHVEPLSKSVAGFRIPLSLAYSHPEVTLSKPLKMVSVDYGADAPYELPVFENGETQTVRNSFITEETQAALVAEWVRDMLQSRKMLSGEFRADPRLDLYDIVTVESKFGDFDAVVLTEIKYTFTGSFQASYGGRVIEGVYL